VLEIIPIHYAAAKDLATMVLSLFEEQKKAAGGRPGAGGLEDIAQVSKIIADERTNSLIVLASKRSIDKVKELIASLDASLEEGAEGRIHVHYLKYAKAKDITSVLQNLAGQASRPGAAAGPGQSAVIAELEDFKVAADDSTNSLLITANLKTYNTLVDKVLSKIDIPRKQVYLEAMVIEFFLSRKKQFGISGQGGALMGSTLGFGETFQQLNGLFDPFNPANTGSAFLNAPGLLGGILSRRTVDILVPKADGTTQTVSVPAFSAFITALDVFGDTNIVASPNLLALDNEESTIEIVRKEPEPGQVNITGTGITQQGPPQRVDAGLTLKLTPQITERGSVRMKIDQKYSTFSTPADPSLKAQAIVERKIQTSVITNDGQTVVLGGLMEDQVRTDLNKIPILGDIPLLGYLFQKRSTDKKKSNLLLFVTPHIIRDSGDFETVLYRKMGEQRDFLNKNFKKKQREDLTATITSHNKDLLDILEKKQGPAGGASVSSRPTEATAAPSGSTPPVITAKPDEEPRVTIILPPSAKLPPPVAPTPAVTTKTTTTTTTAPAKSTTPTPIEVIPPKTPKPEASAKPVPPPATTTTTTTSTTKRAPVIILPQGSTPDLVE
ncbi:MAG: secretin N-terminal domain-containing protein, partial [bacterium]|nr:secretin N-terminal domain-containing protein [bacterium]